MKQTADIKTKLEKLRQETVDSLNDLKESNPFADGDYANDNAAVDTDVREQEAFQRIEAERETLEERLEDIEAALKRIEKGTYGYCQRCNREIPQARLELIPEAAYCVDCERELKQ